MKKEKKSHFNLWIYVIITVCILSSSIAYSALNATLKITGDVQIINGNNRYVLREQNSEREGGFLGTDIDRKKIKTIYFNQPPVVGPYDVSKDGDGSIMMTCTTRTDGYYSIAITAIDGTSADPSITIDMGTSLYEFFYGCEALEEVHFGWVDFSNVTSMAYMFCGCKNLTVVSTDGYYKTIQVPKLDDTDYMFENCENLTDMSFVEFFQFGVNKLDYCDFMFYNCKKIVSINLSNLTLSSSPDVDGMFLGCEQLKTIYLNKADFTKAYDPSPPILYLGSLSGVTIYVLNEANKKWWEDALVQSHVTGTVIIA